MKILAALKKIKHIGRKIDKNIKRIEKWGSFIMDNDQDPDPTYNDEDIKKFQQQVGDWADEIARIRSALHLTNVRTKVEFMGKECSIDELLLFQNIVLPAKMRVFKAMRRKEKSSGWRSETNKDAWVELQFDPRERDMGVEKLENIADELDTLLDNINIETDVVGLD